MKVVILAGGLGTRLAEETEVKPKPMVDIGGRPILWHILKHYAHYGHSEFFIALGYKGEVIKKYFLEYYTGTGSMTINLGSGKLSIHESEDWVVHLMDTGSQTNTGGRVKRLEGWLSDGPFMLTYGDGVSNVDLKALAAFHAANRRVATLTAVRPPARFGGLDLDGDRVRRFTEKPQAGEGWINGGFMVLEPAIFEHVAGDDTSFEADTLKRLSEEGELSAFRHDGFWQCMDTLRDKRQLERAWQIGEAPWKVWK